MEILRRQTGPATPGELWDAIEEVVTNAGQDHDPALWDTIQKWCLCASQAGSNGKSLMAFEVDSVVIDDKEFDKWVGNKLDQALGRRPTGTSAPTMPTAMPPAQNQAPNYLHLSQCVCVLASGNG